MSEASEVAQLRWRCRRGMRELDLLMTGWLDRHYAAASEADRAAFRRLLEMPDPLLLAWLTGRESPSEGSLRQLIDVIRSRD